MKTTKTVPRSRARNAYDLLSDICKIVLDEPKRLRMGTWLQTDRKAIAHKYGPSAVPSCGTVGCVAGWAVALTRGTKYYDRWRGHASIIGADILGLNVDQAYDLFQTLPKSDDGTAAHAREEVRFIRAFQKEHKDQLLATRIRSRESLERAK